MAVSSAGSTGDTAAKQSGALMNLIGKEKDNECKSYTV